MLIAVSAAMNPAEREPFDPEYENGREASSSDGQGGGGGQDAGRGRFPATRWTLVCLAQEGTEVSAHRALSALCEMYWYPLYAYARRSGYPRADAEDLTQGYFGQLLEKGYLDHVAREKGRLRTFLLTSFRNYMSKCRAHDRARKRGGGYRHISIDQEAAEHRYFCITFWSGRRASFIIPTVERRVTSFRLLMLLRSNVQRSIECCRTEASPRRPT